MTLSATVDVSDSLDEARTRLLRTARALVGAWAAALCAMALLVVASLALLLVATTVRPVYVVIWSVLLAATGYNLTRFWPRRVRRPGRLLSRDERVALRRLIDPRGGLTWPDLIRLVPRPEFELAEGQLVVGLPLLASLDRYELRDLYRLAVAEASVEKDPSVRWALRVAHGDIGRPLVGRRPRLTWPTARLSGLLRSRAAALDAEVGNWAGACTRAAARTNQSIASAQAAREQVAKSWSVLCAEWLDPAFERGRRHVAPFTGVRQLLEATDERGRRRHPRPWQAPTGLLADLVACHEEAVALELDERGDRLTPITWDGHPDHVTIPGWRSLVADVLDVALRTSDDHADTLDSVLRLLESAYSDWSEQAAYRVLTAAISVAALDSHEFTASWSWPEGTQLEAEDGWTLPVDSMVSEALDLARDDREVGRAFTGLRETLGRLGVDVHEPLSLDHDPTLRPERPVGSFSARQGVAARFVVVSDRALHVFRDPLGPRVSRLLVPSGPRQASVELRKHMLAVWQGDTTDQLVTVAAADVRRARIGPGTGGLWWRLTLVTTHGTVVLRGRGEGADEEAELRQWLGDRLGRSWMDAPRAVRRIRDAVGLVGATVGTVALLCGLLFTLARPAELSGVVPAALAVGGFVALVVAVLPDAAAELRRRRPR